MAILSPWLHPASERIFPVAIGILPGKGYVLRIETATGAGTIASQGSQTAEKPPWIFHGDASNEDQVTRVLCAARSPLQTLVTWSTHR